MRKSSTTYILPESDGEKKGFLSGRKRERKRISFREKERERKKKGRERKTKIKERKMKVREGERRKRWVEKFFRERLSFSLFLFFSERKQGGNLEKKEREISTN